MREVTLYKLKKEIIPVFDGRDYLEFHRMSAMPVISANNKDEWVDTTYTKDVVSIHKFYENQDLGDGNIVSKDWYVAFDHSFESAMGEYMSIKDQTIRTLAQLLDNKAEELEKTNKQHIKETNKLKQENLVLRSLTEERLKPTLLDRLIWFFT